MEWWRVDKERMNDDDRDNDNDDNKSNKNDDHDDYFD